MENLCLEIIKIIISAFTPFVALYTAIKVVDRKVVNENRRNDLKFCLEFIFEYTLIRKDGLNIHERQFFKNHMSNLKDIPAFIQDDFIDLLFFYNNNEEIISISRGKHCNDAIENVPDSKIEEVYSAAENEYLQIKSEFEGKIKNIYDKINKHRLKINKKIKS